jgi:hypothetical protein
MKVNILKINFLLLIFFFCIFLVTNENKNETSTTNQDKPNGLVRKRKLRRVRSLIRSSIDKLTKEKEKEQNTKKASANLFVDKRPFPFGHW